MNALDFVLGQQNKSLSLSMASSLLSRTGDLFTKQVSFMHRSIKMIDFKFSKGEPNLSIDSAIESIMKESQQVMINSLYS